MDLRKGAKGTVERVAPPAGFTLVEVTFAIVLLASALVILLGLQSSVVDRTVRDANKQEAMLFARQILAAVESSDVPVDIQQWRGPLPDLLEMISTPDRDSKDEPIEDSEMEAIWSVEFKSLPAGIEGLQDIDDSFKHIRLTLVWGPTAVDSLEVNYFTPAEEEPYIEEDELN